ncbi:MAG: T9SS type A sorting domain-containing protein, partial [Chlorobi bacterium]|nr:T9SS type A sorting domain-containing protein [Chlorobiota bacterium]
KKTLTILGLIIAMAIQSQNWSPILPGEKMNYQHTDSAYITNTIWVDSVQVFDDNYTLYYLNRIVKDVPGNPAIALRNQPQFLSKNMITEGYGIYTCSSPFNYLFFTLAGLGQSWGFTSNIEAEITNITEESVFGVPDSVKTISLSDGNEIHLSKNFGILKFPDFENGGYFELTGVQDTEFGEQLIDFWDIFDFEVGDVQQRYAYFKAPPHTKVRITKILFNSKEIFDNYITYDVYELTKGYDYWSNGSVYIDYSNIFSGSITYSLDQYQTANKFQDELITLAGYYCSPNADYFSFAQTSTYTDSLGVNKHWGTFIDSPGFQGLFYEISSSNDTLLPIPNECIAEGPHGMTYTESLGITLKYYDDQFETTDYSYLIGYIKDGDTIGIIHPDSTFITGIRKQSAAFNNYIVYPNPAEDWLYVKPKDLGNGISYSIKLRDIFGQLLREEKQIRSSLYAMDISGLKSGVYFYEIKESSWNVQKGKFIVK